MPTQQREGNVSGGVGNSEAVLWTACSERRLCGFDGTEAVKRESG